MADMSIGKPVDHAPGLRTYIGQLAGAPQFEKHSLLPRGADRKAGVVRELQRVNDQAMAQARPKLEELRRLGLVRDYTVLPFSNTVVVDVPESRAGEAYRALNAVPAMGRIVRNREIRLLPFQEAQAGAAAVQNGVQALEWHVARVGADQIWKQGFKGQGVVVGIIDTGADPTHPALANAYRGRKADGTLDNNYNFFDAFGKKEPYDDNKHGTHVTGIVLGSTPERAVGIAPDAKWIASKILNGSGSGTIESVTKGLEWMLAPRDSAGANPDPTKAPDVVNNSWGTNNGSLTAFQNIWKAFLAAGIEPVAAAGNSGPRPKSVGAPGSYPESITAGATDINDKVANFSSRGPSPLKGAGGKDLKPDVSAPGHQVVSSVPGNKYVALSGTSMASPAVVGVVALLLSKYKDLTHDEMLKALQQGAVDLGTPGPDNDAGAGRVDAVASMKAADAIVAARKPAPAPPTQPPAPPAPPAPPPAEELVA